jgi:hypothetical protein
MIAPEVAVEKLLGFDTPRAIATFLEAEGIRGIRGSAFYCPIALWLRCTTAADLTSVGPRDLAVYLGDDRLTWEWSQKAPLGVFITSFDSGVYSQLEAAP